MSFEKLISRIEQVIGDYLSEYGEEGMVMPYAKDWVICLSMADAGADKYINIRAVSPVSQPRYVSIGLLHESIEMINYGEPLQDEE
jgi:hypothetical protein